MKNLMMTTAIMALNAITKPLAFDPGGSGWKKDKDGKLEIDGSGNPIYVDNSGKEQTVDAGTISRLNGEAKSHREAKEAAEAKVTALEKTVETFKDIDPVKAAAALETLKNIDAKKLVDAGEVQKIRDEVSRGFTEQIAERDKKITDLTGNLNGLTVKTAFNSSKFVQEKIGVPLDMFQSQFGHNFKIEDGKMVPYDSTGSKIFSKTRMGEIADFDEALEIMVDGYAHKDSVLKADDHQGSGNNGGGGSQGGGRSMKRSDFSKLPPVQQAEHAALASKGELQIVD